MHNFIQEEFTDTFKKIERLRKIKKIVIFLTILLVILDTMIAFADPAYLMNSLSIMGLGFSGYFLIKEYENKRINKKESSKILLSIYLIVIGFSLYYIFLNLINR